MDGERPADGQTAVNDGSGEGDAPGSAPGRRSRRPRRPRKKIDKIVNCRLTCLPQVCEVSVSGNERMRTMPDDTTQRRHRLALQEPTPEASGRSIPPIRSDLVGAADTHPSGKATGASILAYPPPPPPPPKNIVSRGLTNGEEAPPPPPPPPPNFFEQRNN